MRSLVVSAVSSVRVERARRFLARVIRGKRARDSCTFVVPSALAATRVIAPLLAPGEALIGVQRAMLDVLALQLAMPRLIEAGLVPLSRVAAQAIAARVLEELDGSGQLGKLAPVRARPGMPLALSRTLSDLALSYPDRARLAEHAPELAAAFEHYGEALREGGFIDRAGILRLATEVAAATPQPPLLVLDVALHHRAEQALVLALQRTAAEALVLVPLGDERTIAALEPELPREAPPGGGATLYDGALTRVQTHVFEPLAPTGVIEGQVEILSAPGEGRECVEAARALLNAARSGTRFDRMAVLMRRGAAYRAQLDEALLRAGIPAFFAEGAERPDAAGRALLALLRCKHEGLSARAFCEYLSLDVAKGTAADSLDEAAVARGSWRRFERLIRDARVLGGRERFARRLAGHAVELTRKQAEDESPKHEQDLEALSALQVFSAELLGRLEALPVRARWGEWLDAIDVLVGAALARPERLRAELAELAPLAPLGPVSLEQVMRVLSPMLRELRSAPLADAAGRVLCAEVEHARGLDFDVVVVLGLAEKVFPEVVREDPLLLDATRAKIDAALEDNAARALGERLKLRVALGAAREHIVLCYPRMDLERGRPRVPSFYGLEVLRAAEGKLPSYEQLMQRAEKASPSRLGWPAPNDPAQAIDAIEHDLACLRTILPSTSAEDKGAARYLLNVNAHLGRALRARAQRWMLRRWTPADGQIDPTGEALVKLAARRLTERAYSPTKLELFAQCPYRFYVRGVLGLREREDPVPIEDLSPSTYGVLVHDALAAFLRHAKLMELFPLRTDAAASQARSLLHKVIEEVAASYREELAPAVTRVFDDAVLAIARDLTRWLDRFGSLSFQPAFIEHEVGNAKTGGVIIAGGFRVAGRVDLVEANGEALSVTDFKSGRIEAPAGARVFGGAMLQPIVYALALEASMPGQTITASRLVGATHKAEHLERDVPLDATGRASALEVLGAIDTAIAQGFLPAAPTEDACERCELLPACGPYEVERTARKDKGRLAVLQNVRRLA
jgi:ATP-dependent helicase/nuclease subunit B